MYWVNTIGVGRRIESTITRIVRRPTRTGPVHKRRVPRASKSYQTTTDGALLGWPYGAVDCLAVLWVTEDPARKAAIGTPKNVSSPEFREIIEKGQK